MKPIPVMILGVLIGHKRFPIQKYLFVLLIVIGVALFVYKDKKAENASDDQTFGWGGALLVIKVGAENVTRSHYLKLTINVSILLCALLLYMYSNYISIFFAVIFVTHGWSDWWNTGQNSC